MHGRVADFYLRAADSLDLLDGVWNPLPIPMPDSNTLSIANEELATQVACTRDQQLCSAAILEALRTELPKSLLQVAAASATDEIALPSQTERHANARLACNAKPVVRKRKASILRTQGREGREAAAYKSRCTTADSGASSGNAAQPPRATTTKAQLLRWESEARKLPRIPHLNYNRVLGRWYARVRDPASGRRIWKGYTCAVHGFYQARDMAIDRLRQFSQLVSPLASGEPDSAGAAEDMQAPLTTEELAMQGNTGDMKHAGSCGSPPEAAAVALAVCGAADVASSERSEASAAVPPLVGAASDGASCSLDAAFSDGGADSGAVGPADMSGGEKSAVEDNDDEQNGTGLKVGKETLLLKASCTGFSMPAPLAREDQPSSALPFGSESTGDICCKPDTVLAQGGESVACSRLTTADCTESALSRCTPLPL